MGNLADLQQLALGENQLSGEIPPELGNFAYLGYLYLNDNQLTGEIPPKLGNLPYLIELRFDGNQLTTEGAEPSPTPRTTAAPTPAATAAPKATPPMAQTSLETDREALVALYNATGGPDWSSNNNWLSDVPISEWEGVTTDDNGRVTRLGLPRNQLSGEIPSELGNLANLRTLILSRNQLSGEIPSELGNLANLTELYLHENQLSGCVPSSLLGRLDTDESNLGGLPFCP